MTWIIWLSAGLMLLSLLVIYFVPDIVEAIRRRLEVKPILPLPKLRYHSNGRWRWGRWVLGILILLLLINYLAPTNSQNATNQQAEAARTKEAAKTVIGSTKITKVMMVTAPISPNWSEYMMIPNTTRFVLLPQGKVVYETLSRKTMHDGPDINMSWGHGLGVIDRTFRCQSEEDYPVVVEIHYEP